MAVVTGSWVDITDAPIPVGAAPQLEFTPSKEALTRTGQLISARPEVATLTGGTFSVNLIPSADVLDRNFHYRVRGYYLDGDAYGISGTTRVDAFEFKLEVPAGGGAIGALIGKKVGNSLVYVGPDAPRSDEFTEFQLNTVTGDLYRIV